MTTEANTTQPKQATKLLFLYRTQRKNRYFTALQTEALADVQSTVIGYNALPAVKRKEVLNRNAVSPSEDAMHTMLERAERQIFHSRDSKTAKALRVAYRPILKYQLRSLYQRLYCYLSEQQPSHIAIWNGLKAQDGVLHAVNKHFNIPVMYFENGVLPNSTTLDFKGINAGGTIPSDPAAFAHHSNQAPGLAAVHTRAYRKAQDAIELPERYMLVPFQLDRDSQILDYSQWIDNMRTLYNNVYFDSATGLEEALDKAECIITVNSTVGLHATLAQKRVIVLGQAFYNIQGLTLSANSVEEFAKAMTQAQTFTPDQALLNRFWNYLADEYVVPGDWNTPDAKHFAAVGGRIRAGMASSASAEYS